MTRDERNHDAEPYDVVVLGRHLTTGLLAAILSRHGVRTAVVPTAADGRPSGETTVPYAAELFFLLASRFDVPAIRAFGMFPDLPAAVRATSGVKRNLGFLYHRDDAAQRPREALQFHVPAEHAEWHLHRPDVDEYAVSLAAENGAAVLPSAAAPGGVRTGDDEVAVTLEDGTVVRGRYLVDGSGDERLLPKGAEAPVADLGGHRARLLYGRLTGVRPFESITSLDRYGKAAPWSAGTLLHSFDGGWVQVAPFDNHDGAQTRTCGVTVSLDPERWPDGGGDPAAEFERLTGHFPDLRRQFASAEGEMVAYDAWPATAAECAGPRCFLFDRAAGRQDLLLSRDVTMGLEMVHATAAGVLDLARSGDWAGDRMRAVGEFQHRLFDFHDRVVSAARTAARDFVLWNAFLRVWLLWSILSALSLKRARLDGEAGDWSVVEHYDDVAFWYRVPDGLPALLDDVLRDIGSVNEGASPERVAAGIFARLRAERFVPPLYRFGDPDARYYTFTRARRLRMLLWVKTTAPDDFRRLLTPDNVTAVPQTRK